MGNSGWKPGSPQHSPCLKPPCSAFLMVHPDTLFHCLIIFHWPHHEYLSSPFCSFAQHHFWWLHSVCCLLLSPFFTDEKIEAWVLSRLAESSWNDHNLPASPRCCSLYSALRNTHTEHLLRSGYLLVSVKNGRPI